MRKALDWASRLLAIAGSFVRRFGPYLAFAAFALALLSIKGLEDNQSRDLDRALAADVAGCQIGNLRLDGNIEGISEALAEITQLVVDRAGLELNLTNEQLNSVAHDVAEQALREQTDLQPRDCATIPGVRQQDLETTTTTFVSLAPGVTAGSG